MIAIKAYKKSIYLNPIIMRFSCLAGLLCVPLLVLSIWCALSIVNWVRYFVPVVMACVRLLSAFLLQFQKCSYCPYLLGYARDVSNDRSKADRDKQS